MIDRLERLKTQVKKHHYHEEALEQILRKLDNETLSRDQVAEQCHSINLCSFSVVLHKGGWHQGRS